MADKAVIDASAIVAALLPDEPVHAAAAHWLDRYALGDLELIAPTLLSYEVANSLLVAERRTRRIAPEQVDAIAEDIERLAIGVHAVPMPVVMSTARRFRCSVYDASYLALAEILGVAMITADRHLWRTVGPRCPYLRWVEEGAVR